MFVSVERIFVEKKSGFDIEAQALLADIRENLLIHSLETLRIINRYDIEGLNAEELEKAVPTIFSEPNADNVMRSLEAEGTVYAVEYLPGQFDQRADSAAQCCSLLTGKAAPKVRCAKVYVLTGKLTKTDIEKIQKYTVNPVEARLASLEPAVTLSLDAPVPPPVAVVENFLSMTHEEMARYHASMGFAMTLADLEFVRDYFASQGRNPHISELKVIDTYWSDHCRHTTFLTRLENVEIMDGELSTPIKEAWRLYLEIRDNVYSGRRPKDITLMDLATIAAKEIKKRGGLVDLDQSEEINACSVVVNADINGETQEWVIMFKNETHNHPTEIEPFGGAATCLGGAIRDPLSGRSYVYQAMRVTGAGNPLAAVSDTLEGKLPQRKLTLTAAAGYSSYGNQIGLSTGQVSEIYDDGYIAKRLEIGAVVGAAPRANIRRERPVPGDVIVLLGGATGRDGCGGATGSSKAHTAESLSTCGAEVQKGNAPTERKLQRLFRSPEVSGLIKRCNDFGAGGVCVAIGELSEALDINLDLVPKKYDGLDGTELAISESQERMAVVLDKNDADKFIALAHAENLDATAVAVVTDTGRLRMTWRGETVVDLERSFLDTNGVTQSANVCIEAPERCGVLTEPLDTVAPLLQKGDMKGALLANLKHLSVCSQKGLSERFDSTIGKGTVLMPFGGVRQLTPACAMAAKLPVEHGDTDTATVMSWGYNPRIARFSPFHGAYFAVAHSLVKLACTGADISRARLTQQEYFERLRDTDTRWGKPCAALLGSVKAQLDFNTPSIGGKDSMSGSFNDLDVPPTLVNFAIATHKASDIISTELKPQESFLGLVKIPYTDDMLPDSGAVKTMCARLHKLIGDKKILAAYPVDNGGVAAALCIMAMGNTVGFTAEAEQGALFASGLCSVVVQADRDAIEELGGRVIGRTCGSEISINGTSLSFDEAIKAYTGTLDPVFQCYAAPLRQSVENLNMPPKALPSCTVKRAVPRVVIPVFPGTNCEVDTARAFEDAGAACDIFVLRNRNADEIKRSIEEFAVLINNANILMLPGGFSGGDEPDGSGKFIATVLRNELISRCVEELLYKRDGLAMGICNGFQALIKTGLLPYGHIGAVRPEDPTLTYNTIGRHISSIVRVRVAGVNSPWMSSCRVGEVYSVAVSHGEGRFACGQEALQSLIQNGQIITQYCDLDGNASADGRYNLNGSVAAIEGIVSPDGRVLGKMGHTERAGRNIAKNVPGSYDMQLFKSGVKYFK
ncbi:MAG: phosphoribosylformylglycinamidine synthase [Firmicutes bacterium]|nr:phosphoribosylformylglycinamidine synthase [Bacillota bacterium]